MRIQLPSGGTAKVTKDVQPETIRALDQMVQKARVALGKCNFCSARADGVYDDVPVCRNCFLEKMPSGHANDEPTAWI